MNYIPIFSLREEKNVFIVIKNENYEITPKVIFCTDKKHSILSSVRKVIMKKKKWLILYWKPIFYLPYMSCILQELFFFLRAWIFGVGGGFSLKALESCWKTFLKFFPQYKNNKVSNFTSSKELIKIKNSEINLNNTHYIVWKIRSIAVDFQVCSLENSCTCKKYGFSKGLYFSWNHYYSILPWQVLLFEKDIYRILLKPRHMKLDFLSWELR